MCTCEEALELISAGLDGALTEPETQKLNEHLASCDACRVLARELQYIHTLLPELEEEASAGFCEAVMEKIAAEQVIPLPKKSRVTFSWRTWVPMAAVFAVALVGAGILNSFQNATGGASGAPVPMAASVEGAGGAALPAPAQDAVIDMQSGAGGKGRSAYGLNGLEGSGGEAPPTAGTEGGASAKADANVPGATPPSLMSGGGGTAHLTPRGALDVLISYFYGEEGLPEDGELVDADGVLGYRLSTGEHADYEGLSQNRKYFMFQLYTLLDGENGPVRQDAELVAVSLDGLSILEQRTGADQSIAPGEDEAFRAATED